MKTFKVISIVLIMGFLAGQTWGDIILSFDPPSTTVTQGAPVAVDLTITGLGDGVAPSLSTFDLDIKWDPAILSFSAASLGDPVLGGQLDLMGLGSISGFDATTPGLVNLFEVSVDSATDLDTLQARDFILATLTFDTIGVGTSSLAFSVNALGDSEGNPLSALLNTGSVTVETTVVPVPGAVALAYLGLGMAGWLLRRKWHIDR